MNNSSVKLQRNSGNAIPQLLPDLLPIKDLLDARTVKKRRWRSWHIILVSALTVWPGSAGSVRIDPADFSTPTCPIGSLD